MYRTGCLSITSWKGTEKPKPKADIMKTSDIKFLKSCFITKMYHNHVWSMAWLSVTSPPLRRRSAMCFLVLLLPFTCSLDLLQPMSFTVIDTACKR